MNGSIAEAMIHGDMSEDGEWLGGLPSRNHKAQPKEPRIACSICCRKFDTLAAKTQHFNAKHGGKP